MATNTILSVLPVCSLHGHMKAMAHANKWSLTSAFCNIFTWAPVNFMWAQARVSPGVATPLCCSIVFGSDNTDNNILFSNYAKIKGHLSHNDWYKHGCLLSSCHSFELHLQEVNKTKSSWNLNI